MNNKRPTPDEFAPAQAAADAGCVRQGDGMSKTGKRDTDISEFFTAPEPADNVNSPAHYTRGRVEIIDCIGAVVTGYDGHSAYCAGNVVKYVARAPFKGSALEDLRKAQWYLSRLIATETYRGEDMGEKLSRIADAAANGDRE